MSWDHASDSEWLALYNKIEKARQSLLTLDRSKAKKDFSQQLIAFRKEFQVDDDLDVPDTDYYQDNDDYSYENTVDLTDKKQILFSSINSSPYEYNTKTGVTWCSHTARLNANNFAIKVPNGNAFDAKDKSPIDDKFISNIDVPENDEFQLNSLNSVDQKANTADLYVYSKWKYAKFWHRCFMFKNVADGKRYVLDPYRLPNPSSKKNPKNPDALRPKLLDDYVKYNKIAKINFYNSPIAVVDQEQLAT